VEGGRVGWKKWKDSGRIEKNWKELGSLRKNWEELGGRIENNWVEEMGRFG
jgi:hypothetical protein